MLLQTRPWHKESVFCGNPRCGFNPVSVIPWHSIQ